MEILKPKLPFLIGVIGQTQKLVVFVKKYAQRGARTHDPEIKSLMLYRLS
jgi:hypothetical protein